MTTVRPVPARPPRPPRPAPHSGSSVVVDRLVLPGAIPIPQASQPSPTRNEGGDGLTTSLSNGSACGFLSLTDQDELIDLVCKTKKKKRDFPEKAISPRVIAQRCSTSITSRGKSPEKANRPQQPLSKSEGGIRLASVPEGYESASLGRAVSESPRGKGTRHSSTNVRKTSAPDIQYSGSPTSSPSVSPRRSLHRAQTEPVFDLPRSPRNAATQSVPSLQLDPPDTIRQSTKLSKLLGAAPDVSDRKPRARTGSMISLRRKSKKKSEVKEVLAATISDSFRKKSSTVSGVTGEKPSQLFGEFDPDSRNLMAQAERRGSLPGSPLLSPHPSPSTMSRSKSIQEEMDGHAAKGRKHRSMSNGKKKKLKGMISAGMKGMKSPGTSPMTSPISSPVSSPRTLSRGSGGLKGSSDSTQPVRRSRNRVHLNFIPLVFDGDTPRDSTPHSLAYDPSYTVKDLLVVIERRVPGCGNLSAYGIYRLDTCEWCMEEKKSLAEYGFDGPVECEFKARPITVTVRCARTGATHEMKETDLSLDCSMVMSTLWFEMPFNLPGTSNDYSFYLPPLVGEVTAAQEEEDAATATRTRQNAVVDDVAVEEFRSGGMWMYDDRPIGRYIDRLIPGDSHARRRGSSGGLRRDNSAGEMPHSAPVVGYGEIELRQRPKSLQVMYADSLSVHRLPFASLEVTIHELIVMACAKKKINTDNAPCYGFVRMQQLSEAPDGSDTHRVRVTQQAWLDANETFGSCGLLDSTKVCFAERPFPVTVISTDGVEHPLELLFATPVKEVITMICAHLGLDTDGNTQYSLRGGSLKEKKDIPLFHWGNLHEQRIPTHDGYVRVKEQLDETPRDKGTEENRLDTKSIWNEEVWEEEKLPDGVKMADLGHVGTLNSLVVELTSQGSINMNFRKAFLSTYRSFTTPRLLLKKLMERYHVPEEVDESERDVIQMRVLTAIKYWVDTEYEDLHGEIQMISAFLEEALVASKGRKVCQVVEIVKSGILKVEKKSHTYQFSDLAPIPSIPKDIGPHCSIADIEDEEIARQLTMHLSQPFSRLKATEFFHQCWSKESTQSQCANVMQMIEHFNRVSCIVPSVILSQTMLKDRVKMMTRFINVAHHLYELKNFHTLTAVISGLNNPAVQRLKHTKAKLAKRSTQQLNELEELTNMQSNYKRLRDHIADVSLPCLPYLGVYLADLTFIEDGNPDLIGALINFEKRKMIFTVITTIMDCQHTPYNLEEVDLLMKIINSTQCFGEKLLYKMSLLVEPRNASKSEIA